MRVGCCQNDGVGSLQSCRTMKEAYAVRRTVPPSAEIQASIDKLLPPRGLVDDPQKMQSELARLGARSLIPRAVEEEFDTWLGRARYERRPEAPTTSAPIRSSSMTRSGRAGLPRPARIAGDRRRHGGTVRRHQTSMATPDLRPEPRLTWARMSRRTFHLRRRSRSRRGLTARSTRAVRRCRPRTHALRERAPASARARPRRASG